MCYTEPSLKRIAEAIRYRVLFPLARNGAEFTNNLTLPQLEAMDDKQILEYAKSLSRDAAFWKRNAAKIKKFEEVYEQASTFDFLGQKLQKAQLLDTGL